MIINDKQKKETIDVLNNIVTERNRIKRVINYLDLILNSKNFAIYSQSSEQISQNSKSLQEVNDWIKNMEKGLDVLSTNTYTIINK